VPSPRDEAALSNQLSNVAEFCSRESHRPIHPAARYEPLTANRPARPFLDVAIEFRESAAELICLHRSAPAAAWTNTRRSSTIELPLIGLAIVYAIDDIDSFRNSVEGVSCWQVLGVACRSRFGDL
jgi:hypothetical protein